TPVYTEIPGWTLPDDSIQDASQLPSQLSNYIDFLEKELGVPVVIVSVGPDRKETLARHPEFA
ncbi:MAG TPA: adenylosuccinate synthetase, partial [Bacteroidia bacterium]|nr:adenylosuccinate synthetase [Bacteroidia bacterium]